MSLKLLKGVSPLVDSVALALLPNTDGAIERSSCCFEVTKSRDVAGLRRTNASRQGACNLGFVKYA